MCESCVPAGAGDGSLRTATSDQRLSEWVGYQLHVYNMENTLRTSKCLQVELKRAQQRADQRQRDKTISESFQSSYQLS